MDNEARLELSSPVAGRNIYTGIWVNWSRGPILGSTLTLTRGRGNLLIAFTAFFVAFISTRFWRVICFALHRYYSTPQARDGIYHQRQALLRNSSSPEWGFWTFSQLGWAWRRSSQSRSFLRILPAASAAALCACGFALAGGFSSQISTGISDEVLMDGKHCGWLNSVHVASSPDTASVIMAEWAKRVNNAANYAQQCYSPHGPGSTCNSFAVPRLEMSVNNEAPCPFENDICRSNSSNIAIDSGLIDSHEHLGQNAPKDQRLLFRHVTQCAPLKTEGYSSIYRGSISNYTLYHYGRRAVNNDTDIYVNLSANTTLLVPSQYASKDSERGILQKIQSGGTPLTSHFESIVQNGTTVRGPWAPIEQLRRRDGDTYLVFLIANEALYIAPTRDDWYRATTPYGTSVLFDGNSSSTGLTTYRSDEAASPMACLQQYQFCNPSLPPGTECGPLGSFLDSLRGAGPLFDLTPERARKGLTLEPAPETGPASRFTWLSAALWVYARNTVGVVQSIGSVALESQQTIRNGLQSKELPNDQWKRDVRNWYSIWLALLQSAWVDITVGITNSPSFEPLVSRPRNQFDQQFCSNQVRKSQPDAENTYIIEETTDQPPQKIRSQEHTSFSMFGLCFTFATGFIIVIASYALEPLFGYLHRRNGSSQSSKYSEWNSNETLHLQCLGYHGQNQGKWRRFEHTVPITQENEPLLPLTFKTREPSDDPRLEQAKLQLRISNRSNTASAFASSVTLTPQQTTSSSEVHPVPEIPLHMPVSSAAFVEPRHPNTNRYRHDLEQQSPYSIPETIQQSDQRVQSTAPFGPTELEHSQRMMAPLGNYFIHVDEMERGHTSQRVSSTGVTETPLAAPAALREAPIQVCTADIGYEDHRASRDTKPGHSISQRR
ncbi:hypothetical protein QBC44DRAFT_371494 [Cladorrhinum sp. PSN332]|nr:hypothetical protein QBC44DRAFT_371494 [Cladorrhinum sp. PSN332]